MYDFVMPFYQTIIDLQQMPLIDKTVRQNLSATFYPSGHMVYLDRGSRSQLKADLAKMYDEATSNHAAMSRIVALQRTTAEKHGAALNPQ